MCFRLWQLHEQVCEWELDGSSPWQINFLKICICKSIEAYISVLCICLSTISFLCDLLNIFYFDVSHAIQTEIVLYCLWYLNNNLRFSKCICCHHFVSFNLVLGWIYHKYIIYAFCSSTVIFHTWRVSNMETVIHLTEGTFLSINRFLASDMRLVSKHHRHWNEIDVTDWRAHLHFVKLCEYQFNMGNLLSW